MPSLLTATALWESSQFLAGGAAMRNAVCSSDSILGMMSVNRGYWHE